MIYSFGSLQLCLSKAEFLDQLGEGRVVTDSTLWK